MSELLAQFVRASLTGMCLAERPGFESRSDPEPFISTFFISHRINLHPNSRLLFQGFGQNTTTAFSPLKLF